MEGKWVPVNYSDSNVFISKFRTKTGLWSLYLPKNHAIPPRLQILAPPESLEIISSFLIPQRIEYAQKYKQYFQYLHEEPKMDEFRRKYYFRVYEVEIKPGVYIARLTKNYDDHGFVEKGLLELLPPRRPTKARYRLVIQRFDEKSTIRTGSTVRHRFSIEPIYCTVASSSTGAHWSRYCVWIIPITSTITVDRHHVSNAGHYYHKQFVV